MSKTWKFALWAYGAAAVATLIFQIVIRLDSDYANLYEQCVGWGACALSLAKAVVWSVIWPVYWPAYFGLI